MRGFKNFISDQITKLSDQIEILSCQIKILGGQITTIHNTQQNELT